MKKLITIVALIGIGLAANAANFVTQSFLNVSGLYVTNTMAITNLITTGTHGTNVAGVAYTNAGVRVIVNSTAGATNIIASQRNLIRDVSLWSDAGGHWFSAVTNVGSASSYFSPVTISVTTTNSSGTVGALQLIFTPVYNGVNESTETAQQWTIGLTPVASSSQTLVTNVPIHLWPGAKGLRLRRITNTATAANTEAILTDVSLNGYIP